MRMWWFLSAAMVLNATANVLIKYSATLAGEETTWVEKLVSRSGLALLLGMALFACNVLFYRKALEAFGITVAYPVMAIGAMGLVTLAGVFLFHERLSWVQAVGLALIVAGIVLVTRPPEAGTAQAPSAVPVERSAPEEP